MRAAGVSFPDLLISKGQYQLRAELPWIAGGEVAGTVRYAPPGHRLRAGDRVWGFLPRQGGFAEVVELGLGDAFPLPDALGFEEGAALGVNFLTAVFALDRRAGLAAGETVLVLGAAGGLGSACLAVARASGAIPIGVVSSEPKREVALAAGAEHVVVGAGWREAVLELTGGRGVDVAADVVGGEDTVEAIRATAPEGRVLILGFAGGEIAKIAMNRPLLRNITIVGAGLGALAETVPDLIETTADRLEQLIAGGLRPIIGTALPFAEGPEALRLLERREAKGKVVLLIDGPT